MVRYILIAFFMMLPLYGLAESEKTQKLIISAGALDNSGVYDAFYQSGIFVGQNQAPFFISNAQTHAFAAHGAVFYSNSPLSAEQIIAASPKSRQHGTSSGLLTKSYGAMALASAKLSDSIKDYLGAVPSNYNYETRELTSGEKIHAYSLNAIKWPEHTAELKILPAVVIQDSNTPAQILVVARALGAWDKKMALVDQLMARSGNNAAYVDLGLNENSRHWSADGAILQAVASRKPASLMLGSAEMASLTQNPKLLESLSVCYPFGDFSMRQTAQANFWSAAGPEKLWPLFANLGTLRRLGDQTALMQKQKHRNLNIIRVFSESAALEAAKSPYVDAVLLAVDHEFVQLPHQEIIEVKRGEIAPIIRISALDISEVLISNKYDAKRVEITRHVVVSKNFEGGYFKPEQVSPALPSLTEVFGADRQWKSSDFDSVLGGMMIEQASADVAIFESENITTAISSSIDNNIARARLMRPGTIATAVINGKQLKKLAGFMAKKALSTNFVMLGLDAKTRKIRERTLNDAERFKVVMSEKALLEIWGVAMLGGFSEDYAQRSIFAEQISIKVTSLFFLSGIKMLPIADTAESLQGALGDFKARQSFDSLLNSQLKQLSPSEIKTFISQPAGSARQSLTLGIDYIDLGFSHTLGNGTYVNYQKGSKVPWISRAGVPLHTHVLLFSKLSLIYDTPHLEISLGNDARYLHIDQKKQPERDKIVSTLDLRLPWERSLFKEKSVVVSPVLKNSYETQIGALAFLAAEGQDKPRKPRTKIFRSLLGTNLNFLDLGFNLDVGGMMLVNFDEISAFEAVNFGPALNFSGKWALYGPLELSSIIKSSYLFGLPDSYRPLKSALSVEGTTWLRVARFYDFNLSLVADILVASLQEAPREIAVSSVFGLTISYGRFFRLFG